MSEQLVGRTLGPYRIVEQLGIGGMATVYKAYQTSMERHVAIKVLPRHFAHDPAFVGRFQQEAKVIARLEHARILPVFDYGEEDGITYIVMRFLQAGTLAERIQEGPMPLDDIARIIAQIGEGLDYAHKRGVIHRDIKPSNIMLDDSGDAYITDFGISKLVEGTAQFTGSGIVGTPAYLSPEQGLGQPVDHRTDIYSLGVMLYQMATGHVPYSAETPMAIVIKHINEPLPSPRTVNPDITTPVEAVIMKAMAKDPNARYQSAGEMAKALHTAVASAGADILAAPVETAEQVPPHRRPTAPSDHTAAISDKAPKTAPLAAPPTAEASAPALPEAAPAPPAQAQKRRIPRWLIVVGSIFGLCLCAFLTLLTLGSRQAQRDAAATASAAALVGDTLGTGDPAPTANVTPGATQEATGEAPADALSCPPGTTAVTLIDFEAAQQVPEFGENLDIQAIEGGHHVLVITPPAEGATHFFGQPMGDSALVVEVLFPPAEGVAPGAAALALMSRAQPGSGEFYAAAFGSGGSVTLTRGEAPLADPILSTNIFDGQPHRVEIQVIGGHISAVIDRDAVAEVDDPSPLPPGVFGLYLVGQQAHLDALALCGAGRGNVAYSDDFESAALGEQWQWSENTPADGWEVSGGILHVTALPGTGIGGEVGPLVVAVPAPDRAYKATVFLDVTPHQHGQGAGLVIFSNAGEPLITLVRGFCDPGVQAECQGDAIYFTRWQARPGGGYESVGEHVAGAGSLPAGGMIGLRLSEDRGSVRALYSLDGSTWHEVGALPLRDVRIGGVGLITAGGIVANDPLTALFDNFVLLIAPVGP